MRTKNAARITPDESEHMGKVKMLRCVVCNAAPPVEAHHIKQGLHFCTVAVCADCHRGSHNGIHGKASMWQIMKLDEMGALNLTLKGIRND